MQADCRGTCRRYDCLGRHAVLCAVASVTCDTPCTQQLNECWAKQSLSQRIVPYTHVFAVCHQYRFTCFLSIIEHILSHRHRHISDSILIKLFSAWTDFVAVVFFFLLFAAYIPSCRCCCRRCVHNKTRRKLKHQQPREIICVYDEHFRCQSLTGNVIRPPFTLYASLMRRVRVCV